MYIISCSTLQSHFKKEKDERIQGSNFPLLSDAIKLHMDIHTYPSRTLSKAFFSILSWWKLLHTVENALHHQPHQSSNPPKPHLARSSPNAQFQPPSCASPPYETPTRPPHRRSYTPPPEPTHRLSSPRAAPGSSSSPPAHRPAPAPTRRTLIATPWPRACAPRGKWRRRWPRIRWRWQSHMSWVAQRRWWECRWRRRCCRWTWGGWSRGRWRRCAGGWRGGHRQWKRRWLGWRCRGRQWYR